MRNNEILILSEINIIKSETKIYICVYLKIIRVKIPLYFMTLLYFLILVLSLQYVNMRLHFNFIVEVY